jgi:hypothetical protein
MCPAGTAPTLVGMGLMKRLTRLDERVFTGLRQQGESAEAFLRRIASGSPPGYNGPAARELYEALREYFAAEHRNT